MPDFILPQEADRCPHCNAVLYLPPSCCEAAMNEHDKLEKRERLEDKLDAAWHDRHEEEPLTVGLAAEDGELDPDYDYPTYEDWR